jgi:hypothetical protein
MVVRDRYAARIRPHHGNFAAQQESYIGLTFTAMVLAFGFYPTTLAPIGAYTNGGALGLTSLLLAVLLSWAAFALNRTHGRIRVALQLPITSIITYLAIHEAVIQYTLGPEAWFWF